MFDLNFCLNCLLPSMVFCAINIVEGKWSIFPIFYYSVMVACLIIPSPWLDYYWCWILRRDSQHLVCLISWEIPWRHGEWENNLYFHKTFMQIKFANQVCLNNWAVVAIFFIFGGRLQLRIIKIILLQDVSSLTILFLLIGRYLSNTMSEPAQVVPDIDEGSSGDTKDGYESSSRLRQPELELRLTKYRDNVNNKEPRVTLTRESLTQPPIRRITEDARPLTAAEILAHRHLLNVT